MLTLSEAVLCYGDLWSSRVDREVGRRVWCHLVRFKTLETAVPIWTDHEHVTGRLGSSFGS